MPYPVDRVASEQERQVEEQYQFMLMAPYRRAAQLQEIPWREHLSDEEKNVVRFAVAFASHFETGTVDSKRLSTLKKLADLLDGTWSK